MGVHNLLKRVCLKVISTILRDGKIIRSTEMSSLQILKTVEPVMGKTLKGVPRVYHAVLAIMTGVAPMRLRLTKTPVLAKAVKVTQLQRVQIAITAAGVEPTAKNMLQILTTARRVTQRT